MIGNDIIEEVRRLADAVALIGQRVTLRKSGSSFVGPCPFHDEKDASFRVYPEEKRFHCFGCQARGDVFEFFQRLDRKTFPAVVREIAASVGLGVPARKRTAEEQRAHEDRRALLGACKAAAARWASRLYGPGGEAARTYLAQRGVTNETARAFGVGYAGPEWHDLHVALGASGISATVQHAAGLLATKTSSSDSLRYYDRFRNRLTFPIADAQGRVIAFGARALDAEPGAKYLNSPETPLYKKARALFALDRAAESIRRTGRAILVEGYFDAVLLHQAGFASTIASCGTALTAEQLEVLAGAGARELVLLFDGDQAGVAAPSRCAGTLLKSEMTTYVARLPAGAGDKTDPDSFVRRRGAAALGQVLDAALPLTEHLIQRAIADHAPDGGHAPVEKKLRVVRELTPTVLATREGLARSAFEKTIARRLDLDIGPLRSELHRACAARTNRA